MKTLVSVAKISTRRRSDDRASATGKQRPADDDGSDRVELVQQSMGRAAGRRPGNDHDRGNAAGEPAAVEKQRVALDVDAGKACRHGVANDSDRAPSECGPVEHTQPTAEPGQDHISTEMPRKLPPKKLTILDVDGLGPAVGDDLGQAACCREHGQRGNERCQPSIGDQGAIDHAAAGAHARR